MSRPKKIVALGKGDRTVASSRYRLWFLAEAWQQNGVEVEIHTERTVETMSWLRLWRLFSASDAVYLQRPLYKKWTFLKCLTALWASFRPTYFDYDDAVQTHSYTEWWLFCLVAKKIIVGSHDLKDSVGVWRGKTVILPTCIPGWLYFTPGHRQRKADGPLVLGWIGNANAHVENLRILIAPFKRLREEKFDFVFELVGVAGNRDVAEMFGFLGPSLHTMDNLDWANVKNTVGVIQGFDVGLMPLADSVWNRGKCSFKAIECMAVGIPVLVSAVGENKVLMAKGLERLLLEDEADWVDAIKGLSGAEIRFEYGKKCQERIRADYTTEMVAGKYLALMGLD